MKSYEKKKKDLASKGMPNPSVKKNVTKKDKDAELPKHKWGVKQGNWQKVHPLDRI